MVQFDSCEQERDETGAIPEGATVCKSFDEINAWLGVKDIVIIQNDYKF